MEIAREGLSLLRGYRMEIQTKKHCLNCGEDLLPGKDFCPGCGQKSKDAVLTFRQLVKDFTQDIFNLDTNLIRTLKALPFPARLTKLYVAGHRKAYFTPIRLFLVSMFLHFTLLLLIINLGNEINNSSILAYMEKGRLLERFDIKSIQYLGEDHCDQIDSLRVGIFEDVIYPESDTFPRKDGWGINSIFQDDDIRKYGVSVKDAYELDADSLYRKYNIDSKKDRLKISQYIKYDTNRLAGVKFIIGNLAWSIILSVFIVSLLLKLVYIRHDIYFVEHACLVMNIHSFSFTLLSPIFLGELFGSWLTNHDWILAWVVGIVALYGFLSFKFYYQQGIVKTILKYTLFALSYILVMAFCSVLILFISVFLF